MTAGITFINRKTGCLYHALQNTSPAMAAAIFRETKLTIPPLDYAVWSGLVWRHMKRENFRARFKSALTQQEVTA